MTVLSILRIIVNMSRKLIFIVQKYLKRLMSEAPKLPLGSVDEEPPKKKAKLGGTINTQQVNTILSNHDQPPKTLDIVCGQFQSHTKL